MAGKPANQRTTPPQVSAAARIPPPLRAQRGTARSKSGESKNCRCISRQTRATVPGPISLEQSCCRAWATACKKGSRKSGIQRPGGGENGVELSVGQFDGLHRGGASLLVRMKASAQCGAVTSGLRPRCAPRAAGLFLISMQRRRRHRDHRHHHRNAFAIVLNQRHDERHRAITSDPLVLRPLRR
jgi:hypothetical protein